MRSMVERDFPLRACATDGPLRHGASRRATSPNGEEFRKAEPETAPTRPSRMNNALLTDIDLGSRPSGAELAAMLSELAPHLAIVFLSSYPRAAAGATAMGIAHAVFVSKQDLDSADGLVSALEQALSTRRAPAATTPPAPDARDGLGALTRHQLEILAMVARGWSNERIAEETASSVRALHYGSFSPICARKPLWARRRWAANPRSRTCMADTWTI